MYKNVCKYDNSDKKKDGVKILISKKIQDKKSFYVDKKHNSQQSFTSLKSLYLYNISLLHIK